jgi:hypothetical protein
VITQLLDEGVMVNLTGVFDAASATAGAAISAGKRVLLR